MNWLGAYELAVCSISRRRLLVSYRGCREAVSLCDWGRFTEQFVQFNPRDTCDAKTLRAASREVNDEL